MAAPKPLGSMTLDPEIVRQDRKQAVKYDQWGVGQKAFYVNSKWSPRSRYIPYESITHVFKRVAVSPGSGKAFLTPVLYMVVRYDDGKEFQETFKYLDRADKMMEQLEKEHPSICLMSPAGEQKRKDREALDEKVANNVLPDGPRHEVTRLEDAKWTLEKRPSLTNALSVTARIKRSLDNIKPMYQWIALIGMILGFLLIGGGVLMRLYGGNSSMAVLLALCGAALAFVMGNAKVMPTPGRNRKKLQADYDKALADMERYLKSEKDFPLPARYAHPYVCKRMIRILKEERATTCEQALEELKSDLKAMDNTVALTGDDYNEVVTIKPLFLVADYQ